MTAAYKTGRCANGAERDRGKRRHHLDTQTAAEVSRGGSWAPALCGTAPGRLSAGWALTVATVDCPACLKKLYDRELRGLAARPRPVDDIPEWAKDRRRERYAAEQAARDYHQSRAGYSDGETYDGTEDEQLAIRNRSAT